MVSGTPIERVPRSALEGLARPAVPRPEAARRLALIQQLEQTQWWRPQSLRAWQLRQAMPLIRSALGDLAEAGGKFEDFRCEIEEA